MGQLGVLLLEEHILLHHKMSEFGTLLGICSVHLVNLIQLVEKL